MFVRRHKVRVGPREYVYLRLVRSFRTPEGKVRHEYLKTLGREDELKKSGALDQLAASFARLDPPAIGARRDVGPLLLVYHYLRRLGLSDLVDRQIPQRGRAHLTHGEVITALVANRLASPSPLYDVAGWASSAALQELFGIPAMLLNDDRLGRALEALAPVAESVRGACLLTAIERFGVEAGRLHLDTTALKFRGAYERSALVHKGWAADREVTRQVQMLAATNPDGITLYARPHPGERAEVSCIVDAMQQLIRALPRGLLICADSAFGRVANLCAAHRAGLRFVVPLRENTGFRERFERDGGHAALRPVRYLSRRQRDLPRSKRTRYRGMVKPWIVIDDESGEERHFKVAYIWSSEEAASIVAARERAFKKAEDGLRRIESDLNRRAPRHYRTKQSVLARVEKLLVPSIGGLLRVDVSEEAGRPTIRWVRDDKALESRKATDGLYALGTNLPGPLSAERVLTTYKDQNLVEMSHRSAKQTLRVRPVFLHNDDRIEALVSIVGLALLVLGLIETDLRRSLGADPEMEGLLPEGRSARPTGRNVLSIFQGLGLTYTPAGIQLDALAPVQSRIFRQLDVNIPWPVAKSRPRNLARHAGSRS
jgi:transposase